MSSRPDIDLEIASKNYAPCPTYAGQWHNKSSGACSCGASHDWHDPFMSHPYDGQENTR